MKKNHKPSHSKLDLHADDLSKQLQQEEKIKDEQRGAARDDTVGNECQNRRRL